jgi:hypothetical protein
VPLPPDVTVDLGFLDSATETEARCRAWLAGAIHYAERTCTLADQVLGPAGNRKAMGPELTRFAPLIAAAAASACADLAQALAAWHDSPPSADLPSGAAGSGVSGAEAA